MARISRKEAPEDLELMLTNDLRRMSFRLIRKIRSGMIRLIE